MDSNDVVCVIQAHNSKGESCGHRVLVGDCNRETQEILLDYTPKEALEKARQVFGPFAQIHIGNGEEELGAADNLIFYSVILGLQIKGQGKTFREAFANASEPRS